MRKKKKKNLFNVIQPQEYNIINRVPRKGLFLRTPAASHATCKNLGILLDHAARFLNNKLPFLAMPWMAKAVFFNFFSSDMYDVATTHILQGFKVDDKEVNRWKLATPESHVYHFAVSIALKFSDYLYL
jgi:hypothetical protein